MMLDYSNFNNCHFSSIQTLLPHKTLKTTDLNIQYVGNNNYLKKLHILCTVDYYNVLWMSLFRNGNYVDCNFVSVEKINNFTNFSLLSGTRYILPVCICCSLNLFSFISVSQGSSLICFEIAKFFRQILGNFFLQYFGKKFHLHLKNPTNKLKLIPFKIYL